MPTYDYECTKCGHTFDAFQNMSDDPLKKCPECRQNSLRRLIGGGMGIIFKGSGFYVTDSRSSGAKKSAGATAASSSETPASKDGNGKSSSGESSDTRTSEKKTSESTSPESKKVAG